ncbi:MAG: four-carbon acid sugar kinase family protein [Bacteroidota bacterium]
MTSEIVLSFYGDDFTGSTDVMESLSMNGVPTALFLHPPTPKEVRQFTLKNKYVSEDGKLLAFGVPGIARSLSPEEMDKELPPIFAQISQIPSRYFHYKICSTFDSSPHIGNIGHATEIALHYFNSPCIPLVVGIPLLNRFCVFGNLFARVDNTVYRIDRHPTMSKHPITPMKEANLVQHLGLQTERQIHQINVLELEGEDGGHKTYEHLATKKSYILFDVLRDGHLRQIGKLLGKRGKAQPQLVVGSSAVSYALCHYWNETGFLNRPKLPKKAQKSKNFIVIAGSCSPRTAEQIAHGLAIGFKDIQLKTLQLIKDKESEIQRCTKKCLEILGKDKVPILYSALGPDDSAIENTKKAMEKSSAHISVGAFLGTSQGTILKNVIDGIGNIRICVAGGDTSGYVSKALEIYALELLTPIAPGSPLCLAHSRNAKYDGLELALKGGQNGSPKYFECIRNGVIDN